jgi:penicillin-binding protein 1C
VIRRRKAWGAAAVGLFAVVAAALLADRAFPPDLSPARDLSVSVADKDGRTLAVFLNDADKLRLPVGAQDVAPLFVDLLLAYEDKRFYSHLGVDPLAAARATLQNLTHGRIVSGASTLTMQTARLLRPAPRGWRAKAAQVFTALQLEARLSKAEILALYLTLAPYGGNVEGVRAAAATWFGKRAAELTPGEAALLVALPRAPEALRPDRAAPAALRAARDGVIARGLAVGALSAQAAAEAMSEPLPNLRRPPPMEAPHAAIRLAGQVKQGEADIRATLDGALQRAVQQALQEALAEQPAHVTLAALIVENKSRKVRAYVGSAAPADVDRLGAVDMVHAVRSPGSTLKPFIYGMGFSLGLLHPQSMVADASTRFGGYAPANFDRGFHGDMTAAEALQRSLNVPAVLALQKIGPQRFVDALTRSGARMVLPRGDVAPSLPVALGGVGATLWDLAALYVALADGGRPAPLILREDEGSAREAGGSVLMTPDSARAVLRILEDVAAPEGRVSGADSAGGGRIALKTGTSFGFRDAWAFGVTSTHTVGVWVGRADGTPTPGRYGAVAAAPVVYRLFDLLPPAPARPSGGAGGDDPANAPAALLRRVQAGKSDLFAPRDPLRLIFPPPGAAVEFSADGPPVQLEARGGRRPLTWLVDGKPLAQTSPLARTALWRPVGAGPARITVMDQTGASAGTVIDVR